MLISVFNNQRDNEPARLDVTWEQFVSSLQQPREAACAFATCARSECDHKAGASWSPAFWSPGATRGLRGIEGVSLLALDVDHLPDDTAVDVLRAKAAQFRHIIHASHSDRPGDRNLRLVVALSRAVTVQEFPRFWRAATLAFELSADEQTKDASRLYYGPSRPSDACHAAEDGTGYMFAHGDGSLLDVDAILATVPPEPMMVDPAGV